MALRKHPTVSARATSNGSREPITQSQQTFIAALLTGKNITEAARESGVTRRAATYWLQGETSVRIEYERARGEALNTFYDRYNRLVERSIETLQSTLESEDRALAFQAAKFVFTLHNARATLPASPQLPQNADSLVEQMRVRSDPLQEILDMTAGPARWVFEDDDG